MPSSSGNTAAQRCDVGVALMSGEPAEHHCPQNVAFLRRVGARIAQRTIGNEGVKQTALLEEIDEERQLPEHRRRRLLVPFDMHRTPKAVEINASRRIAFDNQGVAHPTGEPTKKRYRASCPQECAIPTHPQNLNCGF